MTRYNMKYINLFEEAKIKWHKGKGEFEEEIIEDMPEDSNRLILCNLLWDQYLLDEKYLYEGKIILYNKYILNVSEHGFDFKNVNMDKKIFIYDKSNKKFISFINCYSIPSEEIKNRIVIIRDYNIEEKLNKNI